MHTLVMISSGLLLFGVFLLAVHFVGVISLAFAVKAFLMVWLVVSLLNLWGGVALSGHSLIEQLPFLLLVFGVPSVFALILLRWVTLR
ncbi:hypothetical protein [Martelella alba]|uniref:Inhibitor of the pro-sigma K processing machinery n=1 Tax=Martelella alba TaxID=2590451 RepID=A0ABY2SL38_9HYPH|nr:hypothetical protein [Martelella alba]TKI05740.1 hypothetical protein FCN80_12400 [Martelella alba]